MNIKRHNKRENVISKIRREMQEIKRLQQDIRRDVIRQTNVRNPTAITFKHKRPARPRQKTMINRREKPPNISKRRHTYDASTAKKVTSIKNNNNIGKIMKKKQQQIIRKPATNNIARKMTKMNNSNNIKSKKAAWNNNVNVTKNKVIMTSQHNNMMRNNMSLLSSPGKENNDIVVPSSSTPKSHYHCLRICHNFANNKNNNANNVSLTGEKKNTPRKRIKNDAQVFNESKNEFTSSYTFLSLPDPSQCANELVKEEEEQQQKLAEAGIEMKHSYSSPSRLMTTIWRHGMMVGLAENKNEKHMTKHTYRRLPSKGKLLMRMTASASAFRKWKCEMWHARFYELKFIQKLQAFARRILLSKRIKQRRVAKIIKRNLFLAKLVIKCKKRSSNANVVRKFCNEATQQGKFNVIIKKYRWAVITCQRWCKQWILAKKERMKILGRLFDKRVKAEFKKGRKKFDKYVDQVVKTSDVRTAMKEVADIREQWAKKHMRANMVLKKRRHSTNVFKTKNEILAHIPKFESIIDVPKNETDEEGVLLRKRLAALQYLRDDYKKGHTFRKQFLQKILRKYREKHMIKLRQMKNENKIKSQLQRTVNVYDVKKFIQSDSMHLDGGCEDDEYEEENNNENVMTNVTNIGNNNIKQKQKKQKKKRKSYYPNVVLQQTLLMFSRAKKKDIPAALEDAIKNILTNEKIVLYY